MSFPSKRSTNTTDFGTATKYGGGDINAAFDYIQDAAIRAQTNTFTDFQTIRKASTPDLLHIINAVNTAGTLSRLLFRALDSASNTQTYARVSGRVGTNTDGAENGALLVDIVKAGSLINMLWMDGTGLQFTPTGSNYVILSNTGLTTDRSFTFPDANTELTGNTVAQTLTNKVLDSSCDISDALTAITVPGTQSGATVDINTTASETDMLSYTIPGGAMCINGSARFRVTGYLLQNQATGTTYTFIVKFGGTNLISCVSPSVAQSATKLPFRIEGELYNKNATNANAVSMNILVNDTTAITTGIGSIANDTILFSGNSSSEGADTTKDTTIDQILKVTVTMSVNNSAVHTVVKHKQVQVSQFT